MTTNEPDDIIPALLSEGGYIENPYGDHRSPDDAAVRLVWPNPETGSEGRSEAADRQPDGPDGGEIGPDGDVSWSDLLDVHWLPKAEIEDLLMKEIKDYLALFPNAKILEREWNFVLFERGFWFWKQKDVIVIRLNGKVEYERWEY